jgi:hypothetical protein
VQQSFPEKGYSQRIGQVMSNAALIIDAASKPDAAPPGRAATAGYGVLLGRSAISGNAPSIRSTCESQRLTAVNPQPGAGIAVQHASDSFLHRRRSEVEE